MNEVPPASTRASARPLAGRADFRLGKATVRPSLLTVEGPGGSARGEPRVMRVLVALADARGSVLSREDFLQDCWDGLTVGDDAINRAIAEVRRLLTAVDAGFEVETVARVGYRLSGIEWTTEDSAGPAAPPHGRWLDRRTALTGGVIAVAAIGGGGALLLSQRHEAALDTLVNRGRALMGSSSEPGSKLEARAAALFRQVVDQDPSRADAWGWLALASPRAPEALASAQRALALDPREPNARTVMAVQRLDLDDWTSYEDTLLGVLRDAPNCAAALSELTLFYQGMGRCRDSLTMNERALRVAPLNPSHHARRAMKHWIFGDVGAADRVASGALQLWPRDPVVWNARLIILAYTDRAPAARALLANADARPRNLSPVTLSAWQAMVEAIATRAPGDIARAIEVNSAAATRSAGLAANAIMGFSHLGKIDDAYRVASGLLTQSGPLVVQSGARSARDIYSRLTWGRTQFLFVPACKRLRGDDRFPELCRRTGQLAYWRKRGIWPDPFVRGTLNPADYR